MAVRDILNRLRAMSGWLAAGLVAGLVLGGMTSAPASLSAQNATLPAPYDIGIPRLRDIWVDPVGGDDGHTGDSRDQALARLDTAWLRIPRDEVFADHGYRILLAPGVYPADIIPVYWEARHGTHEHPLIITAADGPGTVTLVAHINMFDLRYTYLLDLTIAPGTDAFHCEQCQHLLLRGMTFIGADPETYNAQETVKVNQSQYVYIEDSDISGAWNNAIDFVAVQYGHIVGNRIHNTGDWCLYLKGGSAYFTVAGNEIFDCLTGGFSAGEGTGLQFMVPPWTQYEAYDIRFVHNIVHDTEGAGAGVQGGYNILIAHNTFYRIGRRSHLLEVVYGARSCDGPAEAEDRVVCIDNLNAGGWGNTVVADGINYTRIGNRHIYIYNNLFHNPPDTQSAYQHFVIFAPFANPPEHVPALAVADEDLRIQGNVIRDGPAGHPIGIEGDAGCAAEHPTCNVEQLQADNLINQAEPALINPAEGDYRLVTAPWPVAPIPPFPQQDWPADVPPGVFDNVTGPHIGASPGR